MASYIGNLPVSGDNSFRILDSISSFTQTFDGSSSASVSTSGSTISLTGHRFITGQRILYSTTGTAIGGLTSGTYYYIIKQDQNTIQLATSLANANSSTYITFTSLGTGTTHTLVVAFDGINTKFKATYNNGTKAQITRAAQLQISINGVIQRPFDISSPPDGFGIEADSNIIFSVPPADTDSFWGNVIATNYSTFDTSDNTVDTFTGNGSQTNFILSKIPANNQNVLVTINGVVQYPNDATNIRAYSVTENVLTFVDPPGNGSVIQVRHIGFAGATSSAVTGFYGRTGNVGLNTSDNIVVNSIGIGTGSPSTSLQIVRNADPVQSNGPLISLKHFTSNSAYPYTGIDLDHYCENPALNQGGAFITFSKNGSQEALIQYDDDIGVDNGFLIKNNTNGPIYFQTNGANERLRIDNVGNILIGTASSTGTVSQRLQVTGGAYISNPSTNTGVGLGVTNPTARLHINAALNNSVTGLFIDAKTRDSGETNAALLRVDAGLAGNNQVGALWFNTSGNLGIGTAVPTQRLEVVGGEIKAGRVDTSQEGGQVSFGRSTDNATAWYIDVYGNTSTPQLRFVDVSNAAVRANIDSSGNFTVNSGNVVIGTSGRGIDFSAYANAAGMTSELLNDYEQGTWTPSVGGNATYNAQAGSYVKIGRLVYLNFDLRITILGTGSSQYIIPSSLPFPYAGIGGNARAAGSINWFINLAISRTAFYLEMDQNGIYVGSSNGSSNTINETGVFGNSSGIMGSICYETSS
jgi:hypothetical protein